MKDTHISFHRLNVLYKRAKRKPNSTNTTQITLTTVNEIKKKKKEEYVSTQRSECRNYFTAKGCSITECIIKVNELTPYKIQQCTNTMHDVIV